MPLNVAGLQADLLGLFSSPPVVMAGDFVDVTASRAACAAAWADAMQAYASGIVPPSTAVAAGAAALETALASAFASPSAAAAVDAALLAFATTVGGGMAGYVATPPAGPPPFSAGLASSQPSHSAAASFWSGAIDTWMKTGIATLAAPPNTVVPWT